MSRKITTHKAEGADEHIEVVALNGPGTGGVHSMYQVKYLAGLNPITTSLKFQDGPLKEAGANGITNEALLAVVLDRLEAFSIGDMGDEYTVSARLSVEDALGALKARTARRLAAGVEGTSEPIPRDDPAGCVPSEPAEAQPAEPVDAVPAEPGSGSTVCCQHEAEKAQEAEKEEPAVV